MDFEWYKPKSYVLDRFSRLFFVLIVLWLSRSEAFSQSDPDIDDIAKIVYLDSLVVKASREDFSVTDFIELVKNDRTFYLAFRNLRAAEYTFSTEMTFWDKKKKKPVTYGALHQQIIDQGCRYQIKKSENYNGNFYKNRNRESRFYTYDLYERLFLLHDTTCNIVVQPQEINFEGEGMEGHVGELKKLIFAPGTRSDVPFIGDKTEVFSEKMRKRYNYFINAEKYGPDSIEAYVFRIEVKPEYISEKNNRTVIKELTTFFARSDFQVLARNYTLAQYKTLFQFNVTMTIQLQKRKDIYLPLQIRYDGFWNVPLKHRETANFTVTFDNYH